MRVTYTFTSNTIFLLFKVKFYYIYCICFSAIPEISFLPWMCTHILNCILVQSQFVSLFTVIVVILVCVLQ